NDPARAECLWQAFSLEPYIIAGSLTSALGNDFAMSRAVEACVGKYVLETKPSGQPERDRDHTA
ncbi:MAG TPA: hypothetical protein VIJ59_03345, partial [Caulobacteraceae bacterium]